MKNDKPTDKTLAELSLTRNVIPLKAHPELANIKPLYHNDIITSKPKPIENVLFPWLPTQGIAFIYAATGVGKTLFTLNVAYAIAGGGNFLKFKAPKPRKVLYIDAEMSFSIMHARYMQAVKEQDELFDPKYFSLLSHELIVPHKLPKISTPEGQSFYNEFIDREEAEVIVFDNLSTLSDIDENISEQWNPIQDWFVSLRAKGKTCIIVHHAGKEKKGYRGTSKMLDVIDTAISLQSLSKEVLESEVSRATKFKIVYQKTRTFGGKEGLAFNATLSPEGWSYESNEQSNIELVVEGLRAKLKHKEIAAEMGVSRQYVSKLASRAAKLGLILE